MHPGKSAYSVKKVKNIGLVEDNVLSLSYGRIIVKPPEKLHGLVPESFETYQIVDPGDIIIRGTDLQNDTTSLRVGISGDRGIITSAYLCMKVKQLLKGQFGYLLLHVYDLQKVLYGLGSGLRQNLDVADIRTLPVLVPPVDEQQDIARYVAWVDKKITSLIRAKQRLIELLNEQKQAVIHRAVTRGLDPDAPMKPTGLDWLPEVPEHWEVLPLKRIVSQIVDTEHKTAPAVEGGRYMVVRTTNIRRGRLITANAYYTDEAGFREWTRRGVPRPGDILFTREAPAGEACIVPKGIDLCMGQRVVLIRVDAERIDPSFVLLLIQYGAIRDFIWLNSQGSTVSHFNMSDIAMMPVLVPPIVEQHEIMEACRSETSSLDAVAERAYREIDLIREYRTRLISDVVTGKLDVRGVHLPEPDADAEVSLDGLESVVAEDSPDTEEVLYADL